MALLMMMSSAPDPEPDPDVSGPEEADDVPPGEPEKPEAAGAYTGAVAALYWQN